MIRKFFILMMVFFLFGCGKKEEPVAEEEIEYISPVRDVFIYSKLDSATQYRINKANGNKEYKNYQMEMLFKDVYDKDLTDINGNVINFKDYDRLIVDVVSVNCSHCKKQVESIDIMSRDLDATFVQYFNEGSKQEIMEFYGEIDIPENLIIIERDEEKVETVTFYFLEHQNHSRW